LSSSLFLVLSVVTMFGIGWQFGGRLPAYFISGLYTLNPIILLNGRRAMMEGSLLGFGLLTIWLAILISRDRTNWYWWLLLTLSAGLTIVSKHTGVLFVGGALGWIGLTVIVRFFSKKLTGKQLGLTLLKLVGGGVGAIVIFIALSPALWNDPVARLGDLIHERQFLLDIQAVSTPGAPTSLLHRLEGVITQPFMTAPVHYEVEFWSKSATVNASIEQYMASPLSGLQFGLLLGLPLTVLAGIGVIVILRQREWWGMLAWLLLTLASLLANPLPWQRYYLPLLPLATVLAGIGFVTVYRFVQKRLQPQSPLVSSQNVPHTKISDGI
jgi:4-amino-4-deoxy-L-arabinose transferase-like glycosyltransferase